MANPDPYRPVRHPDRSLTRDAAAQLAVTADRRRRDGRALHAFGAMFAAFAGGAGLAFAGAPSALLAAAPLFVAAFGVCVWHTLPRRPDPCAGCGRRMEVDYRTCRGRSRRFAVCRPCGRFIDTHWASR